MIRGGSIGDDNNNDGTFDHKMTATSLVFTKPLDTGSYLTALSTITSYIQSYFINDTFARVVPDELNSTHHGTLVGLHFCLGNNLNVQ